MEEQEILNQLDNLPETESDGAGFDVKAYQGKKIKIAKIEHIKDAINFYNGPKVNGRQTFNPASTEIMEKIKIETEKLCTLDEQGNLTTELLTLGELEDGSPRHVTVTSQFNLTKNKEQVWGISHHEKAALWKFMKKMEVTKISELMGKLVMLDIEPDKEDQEKFWLRITR